MEEPAIKRVPRPSRLWWALFAGATALVGAAGGRSSRRGRSRWYRALSKPPAQPPAWMFAPVWTALYCLMSVSAYRVFRTPPAAARKRALAIWWTQLALNGAWSPLFFGARRARMAFLDLVGTTLSAAAYTHEAGEVDRPAAWLMAPYLGWLAYAGYLNLGIIRRNRWLAA
jgi:tryptophan-rich sensory protein